MKILQSIVDTLIESGFNEVIGYKESRVFRPREWEGDEFFQFFSPHVLNYDEGRALAGIIGSMALPAEKNSRRPKKITEEYIITCYTANFPNLRRPPIWGNDHAKDLVWCDKILKVANQFPKSKRELSSMLTENKNIFDVPVRQMNLFDYTK